MKIRKLTEDNYDRVSALLLQTFPGSKYELNLFENLHSNNQDLHEWVCIHVGKIAAYICYSNAYNDDKVCGLHLAPIAVSPHSQGIGIGTELISFSLRQQVIKEKTIFVLGDSKFYKRFGFEQCSSPICPFDSKKMHFQSLNNNIKEGFTVGYEEEFY